MTFLDSFYSPKFDFAQNRSGSKIIKLQQSQALASHFKSFRSIVHCGLTYLWYVSWAVCLQSSLQNKIPEHIEHGTMAKFWVEVRQCQQWFFVNSLSKCFTTGLSMATISPGSISLLAIVYLPCNSVCSIVTASENL